MISRALSVFIVAIVAALLELTGLAGTLARAVQDVIGRRSKRSPIGHAAGCRTTTTWISRANNDLAVGVEIRRRTATRRAANEWVGGPHDWFYDASIGFH